MNLPKEAIKLISIIEQNNLEAYVVGGFLRDNIIGKCSYDIDIASNGTPAKLQEIFKDYKVIETGIKYGTITVIIDHIPIELTTYRVDGKYKNQRHPKSVEFTSKLSLDMARRDFTINALAYNPKTGIIDYYNGINDIEAKLIRSVGNPQERFKEDALRILRALRFSSQLGFTIEDATAQAMFENKESLLTVSPERKLVELKKLLLGDNIKEVILKYTAILDMVIPNLSLMGEISQNCPYHIYNVLEHTAVAMSNIKPLLHLRLAMLLHDIGKINTHTKDEQGIDHFYGHCTVSYEIASSIVNQLRLDNKTASMVVSLVKYHDLPMNADTAWIKKWLNRLGIELFFDLIKVKKADCLAQSPSTQGRLSLIKEVELLAKNVIENGECFSLKQLNINGDDLINLGLSPSPKLRLILEELLDSVITQQLPNEKNALLEYAKNII